jgi:hypothetical protein
MKKRILILFPSLPLSMGLLVLAGLAAYWALFDAPSEQPIAFSHARHVGKIGLACTLCHTAAAQSRQATVPAVKICVDCHRQALNDRPEIRKLLGYWQRQEPIPWVRVHRLPWHVGFSHKPHIRAAIACQDCHGPVAAMERIRQVASLEMGWCLSCHRRLHAPDDCLTCHK